MLFDLLFFGFPLAMGSCLVILALRDQAVRFWRPAFCFLAYCAFYLAGGREVLLYLVVMLMMGGAWAGVGEAGMGGI
jgi:hypothetical protein